MDKNKKLSYILKHIFRLLKYCTKKVSFIVDIKQ